MAGLASRHFDRNLLPARGQLTAAAVKRVVGNHLRFKKATEEELASYNVLQRISYTAVVFVLLPLMVRTGLAMSPGVTSVFPFLVTLVGGQQSARTIHCFAACGLVLFALAHVALVWQTGFRSRPGSGRSPASRGWRAPSASRTATA